jgi:hypothetical protein
MIAGLLKAIAALAGIVPGWIWAAICAGAIATSCATGHQRDSARLQLAELKASTAAQEETRSETARKAEAGHRARERDHAKAIETTTQKATDEKRHLTALVADLRGQLRNRPQRPPAAGGGAVPGGSASPVACTGAQLYREDAELLVGESDRADGLRIQLADCRARYDAAVALTAPP